MEILRVENLSKVYGKGQTQVTVPEEFYNRTTTIYKATKCNESGININSIIASVSNTAFKISMKETNR